jgi:hypothetical protein
MFFRNDVTNVDNASVAYKEDDVPNNQLGDAQIPQCSSLRPHYAVPLMADVSSAQQLRKPRERFAVKEFVLADLRSHSVITCVMTN